ncbi:MAG: carboxypeptidase regulatory-like domain-containing protein, partial [Pyrinomonadaceae bacterium]|nr:carboxypeptidase regulatory-like domain-containing protein [Pyrinomonadaceae bacterium]
MERFYINYSRTLSTLCVLLFLLVLPLRGSGQTTTANISGTVKDESGALLPGVTVTAKNLETGLTRTMVTDTEGRYHISQLTPANYEIQTTSSGFQTAIRTGIDLTVGREAVVNLTLKVGEVTAKVVITGEAPLVETTRSEISSVVDDKKIRDLPVNGRSYDQLVLLQPGIVFYPNAARDLQYGSGVKFSAFGARPHSNLFLVDGTDINDQADFTPGSAAGMVLGIETLREFKVLSSNYGADYGRKSGAVVVAVTKSGTNSFHGNLFGFIRNDNLDARNFFDQQKPEFKRNQFGGTFGGPILQDRLFFFGGYEGLREILGLSTVTVVPNALAHTGCLPDATAPGGIRCFPVNPRVKPYLDLFPLPNGRDNGDGTADYISSAARVTGEDNFTIRVDHKLSDKDSYFVRYTYD